MKPPVHPALLSVLILVSCASAPARVVPSEPTPEVPHVAVVSAPEWTSRTVSMEGSNLVFVVAGPEKSEVVDLALRAMTSYLDLPVTPTSPVVAAQAVQKFLQKMSATSPNDKFVRDGKGWWKIALSRDEWDASRAQLKALFEAAAADPSAELERVADELAKQGRYFDAVTGYVAAAAAAVSDGHPPLPARFRATLAKAQEVFSHFTLASVTPAQTTRVGQPFGSTFDVKLTYGSGPDAPLIPAAALRFSYKAKVNGRLAVTGQSVKTDAQGLVQFELPIPDFAVRDSLVALVDVNPWLEALASAPKDLRDSVASFENLSGDRRLQLPYTVESASKQVPMIVALADFDDKGGVIRRQETTTALIAALQKVGFQTSGIPVNLSLLKSSNDNVILAAWKFQGKTTGRAVYGTVALVSVTADGSQFRAEVAGTVKVADLATSKPVYQLKSSAVASAGDKASSVVQAFRQWATEAAVAMEAELP
jgi:hypothetical protein